MAQLFGISDTAASVIPEECVGWKVTAIMYLIFGPFAFLVFCSYRMNHLINGIKTLNFNRSPNYTIKGMLASLKEAPTLTAKASQCFVFFFDIRFVGGWAPKPGCAAARFWKWMMTAYSDGFVWIITWILLKKIFQSINKNVLNGKYNAIVHIVISTVDLLTFAVYRPFRDNMVNVSQSLAACTNLISVLIAALPFLAPEEWVPEWMTTALQITVVTIGTMILAFQAILDPISKIAGPVFQVTGRMVTTCGSCNLGGALATLGTALWVRFQLICLNRTAAAAKTELIRQKSIAAVCVEANGEVHEGQDELGEARFIAHQGMVYRKGRVFPNYTRLYMVLDHGCLVWYRIEKLAIGEHDQYDISRSEELPETRWFCLGTRIKEIDSKANSRYEIKFGAGYGFLITNQKNVTRRIMCHEKSSRDAWVSKLKKTVNALNIAIGLESMYNDLENDASDTKLSVAENEAESTQNLESNLNIFGVQFQNPEISSDSLPLKLEEVNSATRIALTLNLSMSQIKGNSEAFKSLLISDIAEAADVDAKNRDKIEILDLHAGSIIVHMVLHAGLCGESKTPHQVAHNLSLQVADPESPLRQGIFTSHAVSLDVIAHVSEPSTSYSANPPSFQSSVRASISEKKVISVSGSVVFGSARGVRPLLNLQPGTPSTPRVFQTPYAAMAASPKSHIEHAVITSIRLPLISTMQDEGDESRKLHFEGEAERHFPVRRDLAAIVQPKMENPDSTKYDYEAPDYGFAVSGCAFIPEMTSH